MLSTLALLALNGCGGEAHLPSQESIDDARGRVDAATQAVARARTALELAGILPVYTCGEEQRAFIAAAVAGAEVELGCATITTDAVSETADAVTIDFAPEGCDVLGHRLSGRVIFVYASGDDRMRLDVDLGELVVDGSTLDAAAGYSVCGDETTYWVAVSGPGPGAADRFTVDGSVAVRDGVPVFGSTALVLDGTAEVERAGAIDSVTFQNLDYRVGDTLPRSGTLIVLGGGRRIEARFSRDSPLYGRVVVIIDDHDPVTIPLL